MNDKLDPDTIRQATRLTAASRLTEATALLQRMFRGDIASRGDTAPDAAAGKPTMIGATAETIAETARPLLNAAASAQSHTLRALRDLINRAKPRPGAGLQDLGLKDLDLKGLGLPGLLRPDPVPTPEIVPEGGSFVEASYSNPAGRRDYKLYIPSHAQGRALPLIVMLHGCAQSPDDFAAGTRMNVIAEEQKCFVVYPAQSQDANPAKCWNWFRPGDQLRDQGEPSLIAGITRQVMHDYRVDARRVYVAGLSAGAAAAAVLGATYPDLYAAIGMHSGLACGAANDLSSAFVAMQQGELASASGPEDVTALAGDAPAVPTIIFHGDRDTTVHPRNGEHIIAQSVRATPSRSTVHRGEVPGGHAYTRTVHADARGHAFLEHWDIHGAGHAWSGGSRAGSFTDPRGPDATREMLRFFLEHPLPAQP
jgi:poly(hydroxyalkanoate) depolymerase family esterase